MTCSPRFTLPRRQNSHTDGQEPASETSFLFHKRRRWGFRFNANNQDPATMPSIVKTLHFLLSALITAISVGLLGFAMSTKWSQTSMDCAESGSSLYNGTANIEMTLFNGELNRVSCPTFGGVDKFEGNIPRASRPN